MAIKVSSLAQIKLSQKFRQAAYERKLAKSLQSRKISEKEMLTVGFTNMGVLANLKAFKGMEKLKTAKDFVVMKLFY